MTAISGSYVRTVLLAAHPPSYGIKSGTLALAQADRIVVRSLSARVALHARTGAEVRLVSQGSVQRCDKGISRDRRAMDRGPSNEQIASHQERGARRGRLHMRRRHRGEPCRAAHEVGELT
jgi:hypothetical protein